MLIRFKNLIRKFLNTQTKTVSFASLILAGSYIFSALLGLLRDRLLAGKFGVGDDLDIYYAAFVVPDFIALILIFGAISAALIPVFTSYASKSKDEAWDYLNGFLNTFLGFLIIVCLALIILAPYFVSLVAPGFSAAKKEATVLLMRIMFLSPIILGASNIISGILQVFHRFLATALAPLMYNLGIIIGIVLFFPIFGLKGLAFGVVVGGLMHLLIQLPSFFYSGFNFNFKLSRLRQGYGGQATFKSIKHPGVLKTLKLMAPRSLGLGAAQINIIVITAIGSTLTAGSIAVFNLANNLASFLIYAFSVSLSTAIFPKLSAAFLKEDKIEFKNKFVAAFRQMIFLIMPVSFLIFVLRAQIVRVILGVGNFGWLDTRLTAAALGIFAFGLFAQGLIFLLSKTFYSAQNTKIPALVSIGAVAFNIVASLLLVWLLKNNVWFFAFAQKVLRLEGINDIGVAGLVLAYSLAIILQVGFLLYFLYKKYNLFEISELLGSLPKILAAGLIMALLAFWVRHSLADYGFVALQTFWGVFLQLVISGFAGAACYLLLSHLFKLPELKVITKSFFNGGENTKSLTK